MVYITGDTHGRFERVLEFWSTHSPGKEDILVILGDVGLNYYGDARDTQAKRMLSRLPFTIFCIHGNHEERAENIATYREKLFHNGAVLYEEEFPNILFARDGEVYDLDGRQCLVCGGAYSVDKYFRILRGTHWWPDEQPSDETKAYVENQLERRNWKVDVLLTHTCPEKYVPVEMFISGIDQSKVDNSTELWLDTIEERCQYIEWYCGHYHTNKAIDKLHFLFDDIRELRPIDKGEDT